jgi:hypothetical protein
MRVNAIVCPSGDQTGHASAVANRRGEAAEAGSANTRNSPSATSFFTHAP